MADLDKYSSRFLATSNTDAFCSLDDKKDLLSGESYGELSVGLTLKARLASTVFGFDRNKMEFLSRMIFLGKIDGGNDVLAKINEEMAARGLEPIKELDISFRNFVSIFPDYQKTFTREELTEIFDMIMRRSSTKEGQLLESLVDLQRISKYMKINYGWDASKIMSYEYGQLQLMKVAYDKEHYIKLTPEAQNIVNQMDQIKQNIDSDAIADLVDEMVSGPQNKDNYVILLNNFRYLPQKKTRGVS